MRASIETSQLKLPSTGDRTAIAQESPSTLGWWTRLAFAAGTGLVFAAGVTPPALLLAEPMLVPVAAVLAGVTALVALRGFQTFATHRPTLSEIGFGAVGTLFPAALLGTFMLMFYGVLFLIFSLVGLVPDSIDAERAAFYPTAAVTLLTPAYAAFAVRRTARQLFPEAAGVRSPFYTLTTERRAQLTAGLLGGLTTAIAVAVLVVAVGTGVAGFWAIGLQLLLLFGSSAFWQLGTEERSRSATAAVKTVERALSALGFAVTPDPRTGDESVDPLLTGVDLFAQQQGSAVAVEVKVADKSSTPVDWTEASKLLSAAHALASATQTTNGFETQALLVLIGPRADKSLTLFAHDSSVQVVELPESAAQELETAEGEALRALAGKWFPSFTHEPGRQDHGE